MVSKVLAEALSFLPQGYLFGCTMSTAGSSTTLSVAAGIACDSTGVRMMKLQSALAKTTSAWAAGTAAGGLDTGTIAASTWYHWFVIMNPATGAVDVLFSLSAGTLVLPTGFTLFRRIGAMKTNGSSQWTSFIQLGDEFMWPTTVNDINASTPPFGSRTLYGLSVPTGIQVNALIRAYFTAAAAGTSLIITSPDETDMSPGSWFDLICPGINQYSAGDFNKRTNTSGQLGARQSVSGTATFGFATYGWIDTRGKLS